MTFVLCADPLSETCAKDLKGGNDGRKNDHQSGSERGRLPEGRPLAGRVGQIGRASFGEISDTLVAGESVKLSGFGSFFMRSKGKRMGRNPKTGVEAPIEKRKVMLFKPSLNLKAHMNGELEEEG